MFSTVFLVSYLQTTNCERQFQTPNYLFKLQFRIVSESPRWLLTKNRSKEAYQILKKIANSNKRSIPDTFEAFAFENPKYSKPKDTLDSENLSQCSSQVVHIPVKTTFSKRHKSFLRTIGFDLLL
jgi:hypothetical protein